MKDNLDKQKEERASVTKLMFAYSLTEEEAMDILHKNSSKESPTYLF